MIKVDKAFITFQIEMPVAMFESLQRMFSRRRADPSDTELMQEWALSRGDVSKLDRRGRGCVVLFEIEGGPARMEWGPSQRPYIEGQELRVRVDLGLPPSLEMMVLSRSLAKSLESDAYQQLVRGQQTGIDSALPEEQRWLSAFDPIEIPELLEVARRQFVVLSSSTKLATRWVQGDLANRLVRATSRWLTPEAPFVLMTMRGRVYMRTSAPVLEPELLDGVRSLVETASLRAIGCQKVPRKSEVPSATGAGALAAAAVLASAGGAAAGRGEHLLTESYEDGLPSDLLTLPMVEEFEATDYPSAFGLSDLQTDVKL